MSEPKSGPRLPPRWFIRLFWFTHRRLYRLTRGHLGLWRLVVGLLVSVLGTLVALVSCGGVVDGVPSFEQADTKHAAERVAMRTAQRRFNVVLEPVAPCGHFRELHRVALEPMVMIMPITASRKHMTFASTALTAVSRRWR